MLLSVKAIPLALYIHIPWCVRKCPYCDFNSHELSHSLQQPELYHQYVDALLADASAQFAWVQGREISAIFIGGGTPSLLPIEQYRRLFTGLRQRLPIAAACEITMEANPGTLEHAPFEQYLEVGINRLSIGVQSFDATHLQKLGRIHNPQQAQNAIYQAKQAGFTRVNVDLMHGLPAQSAAGAVADIQMAHDVGATHLSWYQLTIEPNTVFYRQTPVLPDEDRLADIEQAGQARLEALNYRRYEVSAWAGEHDQPCRHNVNYWQFGDYLAIGAGAHGKISLSTDHIDNLAPLDLIQHHLTQQSDTAQIASASANHPEMAANSTIARFSKSRLPKDYLDQNKWSRCFMSVKKASSESAPSMHYLSYPKHIGLQLIPSSELVSEFMLNALRLENGVSWDIFIQRTGLAIEDIAPQVERLVAKGLLVADQQQLLTTAKGRRYLNQVLYEFI